MVLTVPISWLFCEQSNELMLGIQQADHKSGSHDPPLRVIFGTPRSSMGTEREHVLYSHRETWLRCLKCPDDSTKEGEAGQGTESHSHSFSDCGSPSPCRRRPSASELVFTSFLKPYFLLWQQLPATSVSLSWNNKANKEQAFQMPFCSHESYGSSVLNYHSLHFIQ